MTSTSRSTSTPQQNPAHQEAANHAPERIPPRDMLYEEAFYSGRQTALLLGAMGIGFAGLLALLLIIGFGG